jgi:hypothetical protein
LIARVLQARGVSSGEKSSKLKTKWLMSQKPLTCPLFQGITGIGLSDEDHSGGAGSVKMNAVELIETQYAP